MKTGKPLTMKSARTLQLTYNLPISRTSKFWEGLTKGKVYATKCRKCGKLHFPPVVDCGDCGSSNMQWIELDGEGKIVTFTEVVVKPASFSKEPPYIVAIARLKEGIRALAWLTDIERESVKVGLRVRLVAKMDSNGKANYQFILI